MTRVVSIQSYQEELQRVPALLAQTLLLRHLRLDLGHTLHHELPNPTQGGGHGCHGTLRGRVVYCQETL